MDYVLRPSLFFQRFISQNSFLFALSKFEASSNYATSICSSAGGKLAQITRSKKNIFMALEEEYVSGWRKFDVFITLFILLSFCDDLPLKKVLVTFFPTTTNKVYTYLTAM